MDRNTIADFIENIDQELEIEGECEKTPQNIADDMANSVDTYLSKYNVDESEVGILVEISPSELFEGLSIQYSLRYTEEKDSVWPPQKEYEFHNDTKTNRETMDEVYPTVVETLQEEFPEAQIQYNPVHET